jgi:hypothetical protein
MGYGAEDLELLLQILSHESGMSAAFMAFSLPCF